MTIAANTTVTTTALGRRPERLKGQTNFEFLISLVADEIQELEDFLWDLYINRWIDNAAGVQLDILGALVGEPRRLISSADDDYRRLIRARISANSSKGSVTSILRCLPLVIDDAAATIVIRQLFPAAVQAQISDAAVADNVAEIAATFLRDCAAAGVTTTWISNTEASAAAFTFPSAEALVDSGVSATDTTIDLDQGNIDFAAGIAAWPADGGTLVINPGSFTQEIVTYTSRSNAGPTTFSGIVNEIGGSGFRFDHAANEMVVNEQDQAKGFTGARQNVTWGGIVGGTATGNDFLRTVGGGWGDCGAFSDESIAGDGCVEFTKLADSDVIAVGLSESDTDQHYNTIDYCIDMNGGTSVIVIEGGAIKNTSAAAVAGDVARVQRKGTEITYWLNNTLLYTSLVTDAGNPLYVDAAINAINDGITNALLRDYESPAGGTLAEARRFD